MGYETSRNAPTTGEASPASHPVIEEGPNCVGNCPLDRLVEKFCCAMARRLPAQRLKSASSQTHSRTSFSSVFPTEVRVDSSALRRSFGGWVLDRPLDVETSCPSDLETLPHSVSPESPVAALGTTWMELSKTRASCAPTGRGGNCTVERERLASDKKKPQDLAPISYSWMKVDLCSFQMFGVRGHRRVRRLISITGSSKTESLPSGPSASLHRGDTLDSTFNSGREASNMPMSYASCSVCSSIYEDRSSCCGIEGQFTVTISFVHSSTLIQDCIRSFFPNMLLNSIPQNTSGIEPILPCPIVCPKVSCISTTNWIVSLEDSDLLRTVSGHAFMQADYHGEDEIPFLYLCEHQ
jgi:hypothetical protein